MSWHFLITVCATAGLVLSTRFRGVSLPFSWRLPLRWYRRMALASAIAAWLVIVLGGIVRVTGSGTGCGEHWPQCNGHYLPSLEYHELIEWNHRLVAFLVGWLVIATVGSTLLWYRQPRRYLVLALLAFVGYIGQAILGAITVFLHLDQRWVAAHMGNSMLLLSSLILLTMFAYMGAVPRVKANNRLRWLALGTAAWTFVAMLTGSAVIGAKADLSCPAWPQCANTHLAPESLNQWINFGHRLAVGFADVLMLGLTIAVWMTRRHDRRLMTSSHVLAAIYISQVFLGAFTIWLGAPEWIKGAHLALAALTWGAIVVMTTFIWVGPRTAVGNGGDVAQPVVRGQHRGLLPETLSAYISLMKPRIIPLLLIPTVASMLMAAVQQPSSRPLVPLILLTMLGGTLATGGASAINQYIDRDIDARMRRTRKRAVVTGRVAPGNALIFGVVLSALAFVQLALTVNVVAALLAIAGNLFYVFVYTVWLKRTSAQNIVIGGAAGAVPPLVGWAAVTGGVGLPALLFFAIIFFWTPAHFWALALVRQEEYRAAGVPMLPVVKGELATRRNILGYAVTLLVVTVLPWLTHSLGLLYLVVAVSLGLWFVARAVGLLRDGTTARAWRLFKFSNSYLALLYLAMVVDRLFALGGTRWL